MTNFRQIEYVWNDPVVLELTLVNSAPQLVSSLSTIKAFVGQQLSILLEFADAENDRVQIIVKSASDSFSTYSTIDENTANNYTITWTPTLQDIGPMSVYVTYFDKFHQLSPQLAQINLEIDISVYFEYASANQTVYAGQQSSIAVPTIINPANTTFSLR